MTHKTLIVAALLILISAHVSQADWIDDSISPHCSETARQRLADGTRQQIESSVRRAEAAIEPPAATGDLSCLDGLMALPLDSFAPSSGLNGLFTGSLDGIIGQGSQSRPICRFAEQKWREVTRPITTPLETLRRGLPPNLLNGFDIIQQREQSGRISLTPPLQQRDPQKYQPRQTESGAPSKSSRGMLEELWKTFYSTGGSK